MNHHHHTSPVKLDYAGNWAYTVTDPDDATFVRVVSFRAKWAADRSLSFYADGNVEEAFRGAKIAGHQ